MFYNGVFLNNDDKKVSQFLSFSSVPKTCYYDHRSGQLTCYDKSHNPKKKDKSDFYHYIKTPDTPVKESERSFDDLPLYLQYDQAIDIFQRENGRVNRFNKSDNERLITGIRDILIASRDRCKEKYEKWYSDFDIDEYIKDREHSRQSALYAKIKRFGRKAIFNMSKWNWWCTFTRDDSLFADELSWQDSLLRLLGNLANNHGLKFLGVFERGEEGDRLHFHCFLYLPEKCGFHHTLTKVRRWSDKKGRWQEFFESDYFRNRFGQNEWEEVTSEESVFDSIKYMTKYTTKAPVRFYYSRYLPSECLSYVDFADVFFEFHDSTIKYFVDDHKDVLSDYNFTNLREYNFSPGKFSFAN